MLQLMDELGARSFAQKMANEHTQRALAALSETRIEHPAMDILRNLAAAATRRVS